MKSIIYPEVHRVHFQIVGVALAELLQTTRQVIDVVDGQSDPTDHRLSMDLHRSSAGTEVRPIAEVDLGLRIDVEHPVCKEGRINITYKKNINNIIVSPFVVDERLRVRE